MVINMYSNLKPYKPFGDGVVTITQRDDFCLRLWSFADLSAPVRTYCGHSDVIIAYDWRITNGSGYTYAHFGSNN